LIVSIRSKKQAAARNNHFTAKKEPLGNKMNEQNYCNRCDYAALGPIHRACSLAMNYQKSKSIAGALTAESSQVLHAAFSRHSTFGLRERRQPSVMAF
jgi:hypothetical protein